MWKNGWVVIVFVVVCCPEDCVEVKRSESFSRASVGAVWDFFAGYNWVNVFQQSTDNKNVVDSLVKAFWAAVGHGTG